MTLNARNRILITIDIISFVLFGILLVGLVRFVSNGMLSKIPEFERYVDFHSNFILLRNFPLAAMIALILFPLYAGIFGVYMITAFEKTNSIETVYLTCFFAGCFFQSFSVLIPLLELWKNSSSLLIFIGKLQVFGNLLCLISFILLGICIGSSMFVDVDRNVIISVAISVFVACVIPINSTKIFSNFCLGTGFDTILGSLQFIVVLFYVIVFSEYTKKNKIPLLKSPILYGLFMFLGYYFLGFSDNYLSLVICGISLFGGTYGFLRMIRIQYRWI